MAKKSNLPADLNKKAFELVKIATDEDSENNSGVTVDGKNAAAVELGRKGGLKGGKARAASLTPERRKEIAAKAAAKRWGNK